MRRFDVRTNMMTESKRGLRIPIATKLILSFLLIIVITSAIFTVVGIQLINNRIVTEAQEKVGRDLNSAREIYLSKLNHINDVVRLTADRYYIKDALISGNVGSFAEELVRVKDSEGLDLLTITDPSGNVYLNESVLPEYGYAVEYCTHSLMLET